jgi:hypothetical protein
MRFLFYFPIALEVLWTRIPSQPVVAVCISLLTEVFNHKNVLFLMCYPRFSSFMPWAMFMMGFFLCSSWTFSYAASLESVCASILSNINTHAYSQGSWFNWELLLFHFDLFHKLFQCWVFIQTLIFNFIGWKLFWSLSPEAVQSNSWQGYLYCGRLWSHSSCSFIIPTEFGLLISKTKCHFNHLESVLQVFLLLIESFE